MNAKARLASTTVLSGGLDLVTPPVALKPGTAIASCNYEATDSGYRRCDGFERFDGRPKPSEQVYAYLPFITGTQTLTSGQTVTGGTSGASGKLVIDMVVISGSVGASNAVGYLVLTTLSGSFVSGENIRLAGVTKSVSSAASVEFGAPTDALNATYAQAAVEMARALIQPVPGINAIRGVWMFNTDVYAFRDDIGGVFGNIYKSTATGWSQLTVGKRINFDTGATADATVTQAVNQGTYVVLTGNTSGATARIQRQITISGTVGGGNIKGYWVVTNITGTFQVAESVSFTFNNGAGATLVSTATIRNLGFGITETQNIIAGGSYEFANYNFYAATNLGAMYAVSGVNRALEIRNGCVSMIDSIAYPVDTSLPSDTPIRITAHKNRLFLAYTGGSFECSQAGNPNAWSGLLGAADFGMGYEITALAGEIVDTLWIFTTDQVKVLYGSSPDVSAADPFILKPLSPDAGAEARTVQYAGTLLYKDRQGVRTTQTTQAYGDFSIGELTRAIVPLLNLKRASGVTVTGSVRCRKKSQYRLFFSDGTGISIYLGRTKIISGQESAIPVILSFDLGMAARAICAGVDSNNNELLFFGGDDGYIYNLDGGFSCDGTALTSYIRFCFDTCRAPSMEKRFMQLAFEMSKEFWKGDTNPGATFSIGAEFNYSDAFNTPSTESIYTAATEDFTHVGSGGYWDEMTWEDFIWDTPVVGRPVAFIDGIGRNISPSIRTVATYEPPHTIHSYELQFSARRMAVG